MTDDSLRRRRYIRTRLLELVAPDAPLTRRPRTLGVRAAVDEVVALTSAHLRATGRDPEGAAYGIAMLPDVVDEAREILTADLVLKDPSLVGSTPAGAVTSLAEALREALGQVRDRGTLAAAKVEHLRALNNVLHRNYLPTAVACLRGEFRAPARHLLDLGALCVHLVSDARGRAWSDRALRERFESLDVTLDDDAFIIALGTLGGQLAARPLSFTCHVPVHLRLPQAIKLPEALTIVRHAEAPVITRAADALGPRASLRGDFVEIVVEANDRYSAAELAHSRVSAVFHSIRVFLGEQEAAVRGHIVLMFGEGSTRVIDVQPKLPSTARRASAGQIVRIARSALELAARNDNDAVFDAVRHLHRAREAEHPESRFILLWSGIELLINESQDHGTTLKAARALIPPAIALAKIRREVQELTTSLATVFNGADDASTEKRRQLVAHFAAGADTQPDALRVLRWLLHEEEAVWRAPLSLFYDDHPVLVMWCHQLREALKRGDPTAILAYVDAAHARLERQVLRLYRARNSIAHAGVSPSWLSDLSLHANHYLSDLVAICLHARESSPSRPAAEILTERAGHYAAWHRLLADGLPVATRPEHLFRPTLLVGAHTQNHDDGT